MHSVGDVRHLEAGELDVVQGPAAVPAAGALGGRTVLVLVGLTGAGKTTTAQHLAARMPLAAVLPDRRALTDRVILPSMTGGAAAVTDRVERFRLTAAFKERHPGGMGEVLSWLRLPADLPAGAILFDGLRGEAEVTAAAALANGRFLVLDCPPAHRLWRLCGRNDPFDQASATTAVDASAHGTDAIREALRGEGFDALVGAADFARLVRTLVDRAVGPEAVARSAAIIVEESHHYDPDEARAALLRLAPDRTLVLDTAKLDPETVARAAADWLAGE
ncbi:ATPase [Thalassobaculum fulvum]|uniref:ATPase n=1 Tax=Thalassobaculum fulvum TaxID=1633335 RepID=A0A919CP89_9PROT|nr:ATPase [Thalassobaculum fulvum]GHD49125.1 ATPase [Thalassobaculum fulvum]